MCEACKNINNEQIKVIQTSAVPYETATHLIEGYTCSNGGILATTSDEFTAYRYAKIFRDLKFMEVRVKPNTVDAKESIEETLAKLGTDDE